MGFTKDQLCEGRIRDRATALRRKGKNKESSKQTSALPSQQPLHSLASGRGPSLCSLAALGVQQTATTRRVLAHLTL